MKNVLVLLLGLLPAGQVKNRLLSWCGRTWSVAPSAHLGPVLLWRIGQLRVGEDASLGTANIFRSVRSVELGDHVKIGQFNWFSAAAEKVEHADPALAGRVVLERSAAITSRHYVDCSGGVHLQVAAVMGGVRSTVLTHSIDVSDWRQRSRPFVLGARSVLLTNSVVVGGGSVAEDSLVAASALVRGDLLEPGTVYGGIPAKPLRELRQRRRRTDD